MKLWKCIKPKEVVTVGELYKRYYGESGTYFDYDLFFTCLVQNCNKLIIIPWTSSTPYQVTREKTFFEKVLDK